MALKFWKYQGTGNDFVLLDDRTSTFNRSDSQLISKICDRKFGVGADGLILLELEEGYDFKMTYFNADGNESSMCGNGGRCIVAFAKKLGIIEDSCHFLAIDGPHEAKIKGGEFVELKMSDVKEVNHKEDHFVLNTGSPHFVTFVEDIDDINVVENGQAIRYSELYRKEGINVNFVEKTKTGIFVATYERGVEDETLSCGTGVTAAAISNYKSNPIESNKKVNIQTKGGAISVHFDTADATSFQDIWLCGPATLVFEGVFMEK